MSGNDNRSSNSRFIDDDLEESKNALPEQDENDVPSDTKPIESNADEVDYVVPQQRKKHKSRKKTKKSPTDAAMDGYVFIDRSKHRRHRRHKKRLPTWLRVIIIIVSIILALVIAAGAAFLILRGIGRDAMHNYDNIDIVIPLQNDDGQDSADVIDKGRTITYDGKTYRLNENVMTIIFIGYNESDVSSTENHMADAVYIAAIDDKNGKTSIIGISRDTMLDVNVYSVGGKFIDTEKKQLAYAYSYGNEKVSGGENISTSLSRLFFGLPFDNYFAIDLDALEELNDAIGGVTLQSMLEFDSAYYGRIVEVGESITLHGTDAAVYVQDRDISVLESNNTRMDRQLQYIKTFLASIVPAAKRDITTVTNLFSVVSDNADTTLDLPKVTYLASSSLSTMRDSDDINYYRPTGEIKRGTNAEMYLSDKDVLETMLKVFYVRVD